MQPQLGNDEILLGYLGAQDEAAAGLALENLIREHIDPIANAIIRRKLRVGHSAESDLSYDLVSDVSSEITLKMLVRLRRLKSEPAMNPISDLRGYVAVSTYYACDTYLREKYPRRHSLKNQLRYILTHRSGFNAWQGERSVWLCGFSVWEESEVASQSRVRECIDRPEVVCESTGIPADKYEPADLLAAIFDYLRGPVNLDDLVSIVAALWQIKDVVSDTREDILEHAEGNLSSTKFPSMNFSGELESKLENRAHLAVLSSEICELPVRQRIALLLSLRDGAGDSVLALLPILKIATIREIAKTLEMTAKSFSELWNKLPLADTEIAELIAASRQQVINLRKSARERLLRRSRALIS